VDVTHEAILRAIAEYRRNEQRGQPAFGASHLILSRIQDRLAAVAKSGRWECLSPDDLSALKEWRTAIEWLSQPSACELILRSVLVRSDRSVNASDIEDWSQLYRTAVAEERHEMASADDNWESYLESPSLWRFHATADSRSLPASEMLRLRVLRSLIELDRSQDGALVMDYVTRLKRP
jgi:hypothetical protein